MAKTTATDPAPLTPAFDPTREAIASTVRDWVRETLGSRGMDGQETNRIAAAAEVLIDRLTSRVTKGA